TYVCPSSSVTKRDSHSFPTRRSSDLPSVRPFPDPGQEGGNRFPHRELLLPNTVHLPALGQGTDHPEYAEAIFSHRQTRHVLRSRSEEHTSELQSRENLVCRLLLEKRK